MVCFCFCFFLQRKQIQKLISFELWGRGVVSKYGHENRSPGAGGDQNSIADPLGLELQVRHQTWVLGTNSAPLQEQCTLLIAEQKKIVLGLPSFCASEQIQYVSFLSPSHSLVSPSRSVSVSAHNTCLSRKHIFHFISSRSRHLYYFPKGKRKLSELGNI